MFIGHTAVALAAKATAPKASLGLLVTAAYFVDLLWPFFLLLGLEQVRIEPGNTAFTPLAFDSYPWTHSLVMGIVWAVALATVSRVFKADRSTQFIIGLLVVSHWVLDFVSHRPDMPLWPGSAKFGLGLWTSIPATLVVEGALFAIAIAVYVRTTRAADKVGSIAFWLLVAFQLGLWASQPWSAPPPSVEVLAAFGIASWLFPLWAWWGDKHRVAAASRRSTSVLP